VRCRPANMAGLPLRFLQKGPHTLNRKRCRRFPRLRPWYILREVYLHCSPLLPPWSASAGSPLARQEQLVFKPIRVKAKDELKRSKVLVRGLRHFPNLTSVMLKNCSVTGIVLRAVASRCPQLASLNLCRRLLRRPHTRAFAQGLHRGLHCEVPLHHSAPEKKAGTYDSRADCLWGWVL